MKTCKQCRIKKNEDEFYKSKTNIDGFYNKCKVCTEKYSKEYRKKNSIKVNLINKAWVKANPEKVKAKYHKYTKTTRLFHRYNLSSEEFNSLLDTQNKLCAICFGINKSGRSLSVDHNHTTGKVRGLLCHKCNVGIGLFNDRIDLLVNAISYLK